MKFSETFWNSELCRFDGFDTLCRRLKEGNSLVKDYAEFLKLSSQALESYGKMMVKIARTFGAKDNIGILGQSWEALKNQTEGAAINHIATANKLSEESQKSIEFASKQRARRRKSEVTVRYQQSAFKQCYRKSIELKKIMDKRAKESEIASAQYHDGLKGLIHPKEVDKLKQKHLSSNTNQETSEENYRVSIEALEDVRKQWERETEVACEEFQHLEEERIEYMRNSMWLVTNFYSASCVNEDDIYEEVRQVLEKCDVEGDLNVFIQQKQTGSKRPSKVKTEDVPNGSKTAAPSSDDVNTSCDSPPEKSQAESAISYFKKLKFLNGKNSQSQCVQDEKSYTFYWAGKKELEAVAAIDSGNSSASPNSGRLENDENSSDIGPGSPQVKRHNGLPETRAESAQANEEPPYAVVVKKKKERRNGCNDDKGAYALFRVAKEFKSKNFIDLDLKMFDMVKIVSKPNKDFWEVETEEGQRGLFPADCLEPT